MVVIGLGHSRGGPVPLLPFYDLGFEPRSMGAYVNGLLGLGEGVRFRGQPAGIVQEGARLEAKASFHGGGPRGGQGGHNPLSNISIVGHVHGDCPLLGF